VNYAELLFNNNPEIASNLFGRKIGKLDPGYAADLAIFDYTPRTDFNENNWIGHTLFGMETPSDVMTNGIFRIRNNEFIEIDEKDILSNAEKQSQQLWQKMEKIL